MHHVFYVREPPRLTQFTLKQNGMAENFYAYTVSGAFGGLAMTGASLITPDPGARTGKSASVKVISLQNLTVVAGTLLSYMGGLQT